MPLPYTDLCIIERRYAIGSTNQNVDLGIIQSEIAWRSHKMGQVVVAYTPSIV